MSVMLHFHYIQNTSKDDCMISLDNNLADITSLDPGEVFIAGRYHSLVPILKEMYDVEGTGERDYMYAVAIVPKNSTIQRLSDIRGRRACFAGVGTMAGWILPIDKVIYNKNYFNDMWNHKTQF